MMIVNRTSRIMQLAKNLAPALLIFLFMAGASASSAYAQDDQEYKRAYNAAIEAAKAKNYDEAHKQFVRAADLAKKAGDADIADRSNKVAAQIDYNRGKQLSDNEKYEDALKHFEAGIKRYPKYANNYLGKGLALSKVNKTDEAVAVFQEARKSDDSKVARAAEDAIRGMFVYKASSALSRGGEKASRADAQEAISHLTKLQEVIPLDSDAYYYLAEAYKALGDYDQSITAANKGLEMHTGSKSDKARLYFVKGEALMFKGDNASAKAAFSEARFGSFKAPAEHYLETL